MGCLLRPQASAGVLLPDQYSMQMHTLTTLWV